MWELTISNLISLAGSAGVIATLFVVFYFNRKGVRNVLMEIETKVLNDLDEKIHGIAEMMVHHPELIKVINKSQSGMPKELAYAYYILYICGHAFHMRQRKVLSDNEWAGWTRWMKSAFDEGEIKEYWRKDIHPEKWFDTDFEDFINNEIIRQNQT